MQSFGFHVRLTPPEAHLNLFENIHSLRDFKAELFKKPDASTIGLQYPCDQERWVYLERRIFKCVLMR